MELSACLYGACYLSEKGLGEVLKEKGKHLSLKNSLSGAGICKFWLPYFSFLDLLACFLFSLKLYFQSGILLLVLWSYNLKIGICFCICLLPALHYRFCW